MLWSPTSPKPAEGASSSSETNPRRESVSAAAGESSASARQRNPGRRVAQIVKLKPEFLAKYKECHAAVWPEVLQQIRVCNIQDYSIYHDKDSGILFASFKYVGYDYAGDMERMRENPKVREWWAMTDGFQESLVPGATSSESEGAPWWKEVEEVFYLP